MNDANTIPIGLVKRFIIMFYDSILLFALLMFFGLIISVPLDIAYDGQTISIKYILFMLYIQAVAFLFFGWCWTRGGQTLGSKTWRIKLVSDTGNSVTWKQALLRYIGSLLCWASLGAGFLWCYTNKNRLAWNDIISKTRLVKLSAQT